MKHSVIHKRQIQVQPQPTTNVSGQRIDEQTIAGHFGWAELEPAQPGLPMPNLRCIPFFYRDLKKYCSGRMLQMQLSVYPLHPKIGKCISHVRSYPIFATEISLLNEINIKHCDGQLGYKLNEHDMVLSLCDALDFYQFWTDCYRMLSFKDQGSAPKKCGFLQLNGTPTLSFVANKGMTLVPIIHFENVPEELMAKTQVLRGWDLAYLKFCWTVLGFTTNLLAVDSVIVIPLDVISCKLQESAAFEYYWPGVEKTSAFLVG